MKFAQFIELENILNEYGHTSKEFHKTLKDEWSDDKLYEFFGINKALLSWGVKGVLAKKLKNQSKKFIMDSEDTIVEAIRKLISSKRKIKSQMEALKQAEKPIPQKAYEQIMLIENKIIKMVNDSIVKLAAIKTDQIDAKIDGSKKLKESAKLGLKYLWEKLITDAKIQILTKLMEQKIIESEQTVKMLKGAFVKEDNKLKAKAKKVNNEIQKLEKGEGEKKKEGKQKKDPAEGEKVGGEL